MSGNGRQPEPLDLDTLLATTADGACAVNAAGKIVLWTRAAERILGYTAREVLGRACCEVFAGRDTAGNCLCYHGCQVITLVRQGEPIKHFQMATRAKGGKPVWLDISILGVRGARPELATTVHLFRDVTVTRELEALVRERLAQARGPAGNGDASDGGLTRRELEILRLIAGGANTRRIADHLHVSPATVRNHVQNMFGKLGVHSRLEAAAYAARHGLMPPPSAAAPPAPAPVAGTPAGDVRRG